MTCRHVPVLVGRLNLMSLLDMSKNPWAIPSEYGQLSLSVEPWPKPKGSEKSPNGCTIERDLHFPLRERYYYDDNLKFSDGWDRYYTCWDAQYFGVWINETTRQIMTYSHPDETLVTAPDQASFDAEYADMVAFYTSVENLSLT